MLPEASSGIFTASVLLVAVLVVTQVALLVSLQVIMSLWFSKADVKVEELLPVATPFFSHW
jgi:hypothetical protein